MDSCPLHAAKVAICVAAVVLFLGLGLTTAVAQVIYTWIDDQGVHHFSTQPPEDRGYRVVGELETMSRDTPTMTQREWRPPSFETETTEPDPELVREQCQQARDNLAMLDTDRPVMLRQDDGDTVPLDGDRRQEVVEEFRAFIADWC